MVTMDNMTDGNASFLRAARSGNLEKVIEHLKGNIDINTSNANGLNALHLAAKEGHVVVVTELLKRGANVNAATKKGNTALHIASLAGQEEVVRVLIQLGANVNVQSQNGFTPLYMAAQENHDHVVSYLLANGANQSLATEDGFTPLAVALQQGHDRVVAVLLENDTKGRVRLPALHIAAKKDDCKAATLLLQSDHNPDVTSKSGFTPLHIAAHYGNENIAKILLSKGADVNYAAKHQITPLHVASKWGKTNMVVLLLEKGANIEASTRDGLTPLHCASRSGHEQVVDLLLEKGAPFLAKTKNGLAPLHMASQGDHVDSARILLYHKAPVDDVTVDYLTALHVAAHCGHVKVAKLLLDRKADPNARALNGFTPLHIACKKNRIKVVELLLKHGASIEATTESGLTPLHVASFMGCMNIVIYLIQNGAHPDVPTVRGETPLHLAARANQTDIIRILLRNGASVDARAREEQTPLHIAARLGNVDIVSLLLQHGAAVDAVTKDMYTALHIAAKEDQEEVASALLDHGASLTSTTKKGFTPLHLAAKYGNIKVARLLLQKGAPVDAQGKNGVTPLHVAAHYDHVNVALLLLDKGASPHAMAKNGYTPLHIAAKKNQMDIASTLLEYGAKTNSESKAGFTPLHLSSQEGHAEMSALLIEHKADVNHRANNGLTPLHLCAQDDRVSVASILTKNGAEVCPKTKAGYTPLHVAAHFGQINMVRFLLQNEASVHNTTSHGYTPLHQAAQQGHTLVVNLLLENQASPNVTTMQGQTPLSIAQRLGYISVVETLKVVTETTVITTTTTVTEEKYKVVAPETMQETFMTDSEDEGGEEAMLGDQSFRYLTADEMKSLGDDSLPIDVTKDEKHHDVMQSVKQFGAPMVEEDNLSPQHVTPVESGFSEKYSPDNVDLARAPVHAGSFSWDDDFYYSFPPKGMLRSRFLVSFMVDARGGAMRGCRHSGVRVIIPPRKAAMPMRITCRYLRKEKLIHPPPLMEGEACASRILEMGPVSAKFLGPVIIEVPHFASTRGKEREIIILRSDTGESWREHTLEASEEAVQEVLNESFEGEELSALEDLNTNRITRILTTDFPQYFAIVCRVRQESHGVGPEGGMVSSTVVPQVQAIFPEGALTKKIRVGLQAQPIAPELVAKLLGNRVAVSPIVTVEPRRRKFHKPITLTIPVPQAVTKGMINQYSGEAPTLRLLCSITGGSSKAQWEDVTGSTPLTFVNDCVSFTTTVSARFWLMDCRQVNEVTRFATELYQEAVYVPFMSKFVIFAKRNDPYEAQLRVFCMTDDKEDKTLESQEHFTEVAKSRDVEVLEGKTEYLEFAGNLVPVTKSGEQLKFTFQAFHENRLPFTIRVKDPHAEPMGRIAFMREPRAGRGEPPQVPICNLNVALPDITLSESSPDVLELVTLEKRYDFIQEAGLSKPELIHRADLRLSDIARELDKDWISLAQQLDLSEGDIEQLKSETAGEPPEQALIMLRMWLQKSGPKATGNELEKALRRINREDIINHCMFNVELVTDDVEKAVAKVHLDQSGFDVFKEELGSSREASMRRGASLDISYDEQDIMKEAESAAETSSETGSLFEREHIPHSLTDDKVEKPEIDESAIILAEVVSKNDNETSGLNSNTICDSLCVELDSSSLNRETSQTASSNGIIDDQQNENIDRTDVTIASLNESRSESQIENEKCQNNRKLHEFWPPDKISLNEFQRMSTDAVPKEIKTINTKNETDFEENSYLPSSGGKIYIEDINISPSNSTHLENAGEKTNRENDLNKSHNFDISNVNEVNDLGYCSMDKDPSNSSVSKTIIDDKKDIIDISRLDQKFSDSEKYPVCIMPCEPKMNMVEILNNRNIQMQNLASKQLDSNFNLGLHPPDELSRVDLSQFPVEETTKATNLKSEVENQDLPKNTSTSGCDIDAERADNNLVEDGKIRRASKTPPPSPVDEEVIQDKRADTLKDISPSALVFHIKEDTFKKQVDTTGEANMPPVAQELVARLTESETWPSGDLDTSQVSVSSLPDDEKSEANTAVFETTVVSTKETISTLGASDTFIPATTEILQTHAEQDNVEKTEVDGSGSTTHIIQKTTHMTIVGKIPDEVLAGEDQALKSGIVLEEHSQPSHEQLIPADQKDAEPKITTVELTTTKQIEEAMPVKDSQALRTEIVEETAADTSKDVVEESSKEEVIQSKETSSVAQVIPTERKMTEEITSTECQSSTSAQIYEVREEGFSKTEPSQEHVLKASESTDEDLVVGMEESSFVKKEIISDSTVVKQFVPCAFDNTAFAGADFIDEVEQAVPVRARSPYEVIREDQGEVPALGIGQTLNENVIKEVSGSVSKIDFMPKQMDIRRRPILQHIPSEISEEDLVEREIISPVTKEFEVFEEADIKGQGPLGTEFSHSVIGTAAEISSSIDDDKQSDFNKGNGSESPIISENIIHSDSNEIPSPHSVHHISSHTERDADESKIKKQIENLRSPPNSLPIKRDLTESVIKTDEGTTPESDTGLPTSPFELISGSEISDEEHKTGLPSSITLMKSDQEDRSQDSVITTTQSQSYTESTFSASIRTSSKDLSDSCTHNEGLQFQSSKTTRTGITTFTKTLKDTSDEYMQEMDKQLLNGPGEVEYRPEYDDDHEYRPEERLSGFETMRVSEGSANDAFESDDYKKSRYSSVSDDVIDSEIGEICNSDQVLEDIIERPVTPEPPKDDERDLIIETHVKREFHSSRSETLDFKREEFLPSTADEQLILSPLGSPDELKPGFAYGMQFEKEILDPTEEAMDIDSDQYSEEKEPPYAYGMRFERDPDLEEDEIPCYGDLYTHEEEDEDALENGEKPKSFQKQVKEADFDILAGRKYFSKNVEFDDLSMSSLQEFERLEAEIVSGRKSSIGSLDSLNGKNHTSKSGEHDDVSMSSLTEFERIERECTETEKIDPAMQESITQLSEIEEGHESQASEASHGKSDEAKEDLSILDDQDLKLQDIDEMILDPPGIAPEEQPYQYIIQKSHTTAKGVSSSILKKESTDYAGAQDAAENQIEIRKMTTIKHVSDTRQKSVETYSYDSVKEDDMDQDSLRDEFSLKPDSLIDDGNKDFQDSLHEDKLDDADSLQGDIPDEMRDSLFEEKQIEDDSLHEMDILPDESSLSLESSLAAALSHDSSKADDRKRYSFDGESDALRLNLRDIVTSSDKAEVVVTDYMRGDVMVSSTDSLEQSRSAAFAAFQMESESAMSSSLNSAITSEDYTMFSSTDTLEHEGRITFRYEDIPVDDLETLIRDGKKVFVDSEGNIQAQYNVKHILEAEDNINSLCSREKTEVELPSSTTVHVHSAVTSVKYADDRTKMSAPIPFSTTTGVKTEDISYESSDFDPNVEVEEVHTTDEFGNPKIIRKVKRFVHTKTQFSSSSSPKDVEEKLKEFLRKNAAGEGAGMGEEEIKEEKTTDAKGNVVLIRTVQQQMLSEPQVHSKTFMGPDADTLSQDFVETFKTLDPTENVCEYEKIDDQGNVVRVTQQVIIKPEVHSISFSGPNARQQMEDYMKQWTATSQSADEYEAGKTSTFFTADELHRFSEQSQQHGVSESSIHSCVEEPSESKVFASQSSERVTVQADAAQASSSGKEETHETRVEEPQQ